MNSKLTIFDDNAGQHLLSDKANIKGTDVILKSLDNGKVLFRGHNKVIISGSEFNALKDFDYDGFVGDTDFLASIPSYDVAFKELGNASKRMRRRLIRCLPSHHAGARAARPASMAAGPMCFHWPSRTIFAPETARLFVEKAMPMSVIGLPARRNFSVYSFAWICSMAFCGVESRFTSMT